MNPLGGGQYVLPMTGFPERFFHTGKKKLKRRIFMKEKSQK